MQWRHNCLLFVVDHARGCYAGQFKWGTLRHFRETLRGHLIAMGDRTPHHLHINTHCSGIHGETLPPSLPPSLPPFMPASLSNALIVIMARAQSPQHSPTTSCHRLACSLNSLTTSSTVTPSSCNMGGGALVKGPLHQQILLTELFGPSSFLRRSSPSLMAAVTRGWSSVAEPEGLFL